MSLLPKLRFPRRAAAFVAVLSLTSALACADIFTLKDGSKVEGRVLSETPSTVEIEYHSSPTILDNRTLQKSEIASQEKASPDAAAYQALAGVQLGANSGSAEFYTKAVTALQNFLNQYPQSTHVAEVADRLTKFAEEKRRVEGGELKINNQWISREEAQRERYQIYAQLALQQMLETARRGDLITALNIFDQIEHTYPGARVFPDAVDSARKLLPLLKQQVETGLATYKTRKEERDAGVKLTSERDRPALLAAIAAEEKSNAAALDAAVKAKLKWSPLLPNSDKSYTINLAKIDPEVKRLEALTVSKMRDSIKLSDAAAEQFKNSEFTEAQKGFGEALKLWPANEVATRLSKEAGTQATAQAAAAKTAATEAAAAEAAAPKATPRRPATPNPDVPPVAVAKPEEEGFIAQHGLLLLGVLVVVGGGAGYLFTQAKKKKAGDSADVVDIEP